jgi:Nuclease-related domain/UvrD/REP helicase N-terminal domain
VAQFHPSLDELDHLVTPLNDGERETARALETLDDGWTVYIQPRVGPDLPDFIAVHDRFGVCAIEVKDWRPTMYRQRDDGVIEHRSHAGGWTACAEQPRYQAYRYRTSIFDNHFATPDQGQHPTEAVRAVVVFPQMSNEQARKLVEQPSVTDDEHGVAVWGGDGLRQSIDRIVRGRGCTTPAPSSLARLRRSLAESSILTELRQPARLSPDAAKIERNPSNARIRRVRGAAGSGKSFGLAARAARLAADGKQVLVLSFNVTLTNYLRTLVNARCREYGANPTRVTCVSFHSLCRRIVDDAERAGALTTRHPDVEWFDEIVLRAREACELGHAPRFDAVLIDEGQDFTLDWWNLLREHVVVDDGEMLLVADPTQDVYEKRSWTDEDQMLGAGFSGRWTKLSGSYRMPSDLTPIANAFAERFLPGEKLSGTCPEEDVADEGTSHSRSIRRWRNIDRPSDLGTEVGREVIRLLETNNGLVLSDIAFLLESHDDGIRAVHEIEAAGYRVNHAFGRTKAERGRRKRRFWPDADGIKGCTIHSFKGWETPTLVMGIGVSIGARRLAYVSMTRAKGNWTGAHSYVSVVNADLGIAPFQSTFEKWAAPVVTRLEAPAIA